ncbi:protein of unknown function [Xenorhabdus poinarii G6]|uniref:Uncharacterized protein n=1 Tax=Xenorhabdus poinarii G6 TaxID=1354304 RepID=A0A068R3T2_9GAMM|nr:hypothetical protein [Xenorhabdus poinarii]CDG21937.1 protein of unknown function [Xenorhabdus poinarii G6]
MSDTSKVTIILEPPTFPQAENGIINIEAQKASGEKYIFMEIPYYYNRQPEDMLEGYLKIKESGTILKSLP